MKLSEQRIFTQSGHRAISTGNAALLPSGSETHAVMRREGNHKEAEINLRRDPDPDADFYYYYQFEIYHEPYLIWEKEVWEAILGACDVFRIEVRGRYAGDVVLEERRKGTRYIVDFSLLPEYQGKGVGKRVLAEIRKGIRKLTAITRKETLPFFLKSGFILKRRLKDYYAYGVDGYYIESNGPRS